MSHSHGYYTDLAQNGASAAGRPHPQPYSSLLYHTQAPQHLNHPHQQPQPQLQQHPQINLNTPETQTQTQAQTQNINNQHLIQNPQAQEPSKYLYEWTRDIDNHEDFVMYSVGADELPQLMLASANNNHQQPHQPQQACAQFNEPAQLVQNQNQNINFNTHPHHHHHQVQLQVTGCQLPLSQRNSIINCASGDHHHNHHHQQQKHSDYQHQHQHQHNNNHQQHQAIRQRTNSSCSTKYVHLSPSSHLNSAVHKLRLHNNINNNNNILNKIHKSARRSSPVRPQSLSPRKFDCASPMSCKSDKSLAPDFDYESSSQSPTGFASSMMMNGQHAGHCGDISGAGGINYQHQFGSTASEALTMGINLEQYISKRNERERSRVRSVNYAFDSLKGILPLEGDQLSKRMSKVEILRNAISYIRELEVMLKAGAAGGANPSATATATATAITTGITTLPFGQSSSPASSSSSGTWSASQTLTPNAMASPSNQENRNQHQHETQRQPHQGHNNTTTWLEQQHYENHDTQQQQVSQQQLKSKGAEPSPN